MHVEDREWKKDQKCDHFLQDFQLSQAHRGVPDAIGWNLKQIFKKRDPPTQDRCDVPLLIGPIPQMGVPREGHERVGANEKKRRSDQNKCFHTMIVPLINFENALVISFRASLLAILFQTLER
jgi:hypothetical protein